MKQNEYFPNQIHCNFMLLFKILPWQICRFDPVTEQQEQIPIATSVTFHNVTVLMVLAPSAIEYLGITLH